MSKVALVAAFAMLLVACGGGGSSTSVPAPSALSYTSPEQATMGKAITPLSPKVTGTVTSYAVSPALPAGVSLSTTSGVISGTPTTTVAQATYTITATNATGSTTFAWVLTVKAATAAGVFIDAPTRGLSYVASPSGLSGTTDATGAFSFQAGDTVSFTLGAGSAGSLSIGSVIPSVPSSGAAKLFVLALNNGVQVAQVLQSLNHGSASAMNVSGLTLPAQDLSNLNNYIASGGTALPVSVSTDVQMLAQAQVNSNASSAGYTFVASGGASVTATLAALQQTLTQLGTTSGVDLSTVLPGKVVFHQGISTGDSQENYGITYFNSNGTVANVSNNPNDPTSATYTTSSNILTLNQPGGLIDTITISYIDSLQGLWIDSASGGTTGAGSYVFLQSWKPSDIAGKTLTLTGSLGECGGVPLQIVINATGANFTANCSGSTVQRGIGTVAAAASIPGVIVFTDSTAPAAVHYAGLVAGGTVASGSVAVVETVSPGGSATNGILGLSSK
jgi:hypothetical protein